MEDLCCLLTTPNLEVYHDAVRKWLYTRWLGRYNESSMQQAIESICICMRGRPYTKVLSDHSGFVGEWPADAPWAMEGYFNYLAAQGVAHFAWVYNESRHNLSTMQRMLSRVTCPAVAIFQDVASAYEWLRRCPTILVVNPG
ncbi:hypothetical protein [Hymenobacter sp. BT559]|uniref:hypothetical protein n=1 Tax=Hymenobacter sp. BT559 TaxID=2795729 RepID=UPI0018EC01F7|nr:hypothetical protein [Hymenobacter sp. BT559]MBJ6145560.1 hypothetical protein [Hymenobacter sp. BT559]